MSKKDDTSKALKKKLKKLKKLQDEIAALKKTADKDSRGAKAKDAKKKDVKKKDKKRAKSAPKGKRKTGKKDNGKKSAPESMTTPSTPSLVRSEPVKVVAKEAAAVPPSARVATG